ncbi:hypothetical protein B0H13DRAFT_2672346, partial [Mycena leptocephala]
MDAPLDPEIFAYYWSTVKGTLYDCMTALVLYGILLVLAILAFYLLLSRSKAPGTRYFIAITGTMLFLSTTQAILRPAIVLFGFRLLSEELAGDLAAMDQTASICQAILIAQDIVQVTNVLLADAVLIYRCYLVWGRKIYPVILPICMLATCTVLGYVSTYEGLLEHHLHPNFLGPVLQAWIPLTMTLLTNVVLAGLTAGRIWWARRELHAALSESAITLRYNTAITMILESGSIYCATVIVTIVASNTCGPTSPVPSIFMG